MKYLGDFIIESNEIWFSLYLEGYNCFVLGIEWGFNVVIYVRVLVLEWLFKIKYVLKKKDNWVNDWEFFKKKGKFFVLILEVFF